MLFITEQYFFKKKNKHRLIQDYKLSIGSEEVLYKFFLHVFGSHQKLKIQDGNKFIILN